MNPLLDHKIAVSNSVTLGGVNATHSAIITGPNEAGKSTSAIKCWPIALVFAQSFGIAPAKRLVCSPFAKIMTYLNITDDIAVGNSHFKAGVLRASEIVAMTKKLQPGQYAFVALDEVFNGTTYKEGQAAAYSLIDYLGNHPQLLTVTATHFPAITDLEEKNKHLFKNFKVEVAYDNNGAMKYPFKLEPGISRQCIALDILRKEGYGEDFLVRAQEMIGAHDNI